MSIISKVRGCVTSPRETFTTILEEDLRKGILLVLITALLAAVAGFAYGQKITALGPVVLTLTPAALALGGGLGLLVGWIVPSAAIHALASMQTGGGNLRRFLALTGFATTPHILRHIIRIMDAATVDNGLLLEAIASKANPSGFVVKLFSHNTDVLNVFGLWEMALIVIAVTVNYKMETRRAAFTTIIVYLAYLLLRTMLVG